MTDDRLNAEAAGRLGEIARRAGVDDRGRPTPAGSEVVSAATILAEPKADVFSKCQCAFEFARQRRAHV